MDRSAAFMGHEYALEAEECAQAGNLRRAEQLERLASGSYLRAMDAVRQEDAKTRAALKLIADSHEQRAVRWHMMLNFNQGADPSNQTSPTTAPAHFMPATAPATAPTTDEKQLKPRSSNTGSSDYNQPLQTAATEMEELYDRLKNLGLMGHSHAAAAALHATPPGHHTQLKQYLSSDLGDSFCLLPKSHGKSPSPLTAYRVDGEATLKAAVASRMKNQRERSVLLLGSACAPTGRRLMEKQASSRPSMMDDKLEAMPDKQITPSTETASGHHRRPSLNTDEMEIELLKAALAHQKYEANRLMHTVKTLSSENAKLVQDTENMARLREENKRLVHAMEEFKTDYHQKFAVLKRALEEWRRQKSHEVPHDPREMTSQMEQLLVLQNELAAEQETSRQKDVQLKRYETWFQSLKASAKAKQQSRESPTEVNRSHSFDAQALPPQSMRREL
ncbi:Aste57867_2364 [Aphanomyces stellatus]|uniref:Aste57867_2364 protein n=1 Tax=Aphanomyces stellatus TaxID=120398 RepID=A0A485K8U5_9STRA|nr:hypothetical protein As57867_002359 [Aphanomyces stellatus]VFT79565.1 Aste57867_2364 [Aphanomyces stellatus]